MRSIILILILSSCSAQWHIRKAIEKDPTIIQSDTITVIDTVQIITKEVQVDSVFKLSTDTVTIRKDKLTIKHYYQRDSIFIWGECASDTIIQFKEIKVPYQQVVYQEKFIPNWVWFVLIIIILAFLIKRFLF